jgi:folylpolyglutamate synthase/dihydropteroate synthase
VSTDTVLDALTLARAEVPDDGMLVVTGSLYVVAEARALLVGSSR